MREAYQIALKLLLAVSGLVAGIGSLSLWSSAEPSWGFIHTVLLCWILFAVCCGAVEKMGANA